MTSNEALLKKFDALDSDIEEMLRRYRKMKRDRTTLLEACKIAASHFKPICDWRKDGEIIERLENATDQAESEE